MFFPEFDEKAGGISTSKECRIKIGCDSIDTVSFRFCNRLAHDLAKYATMMDFWISQLKSARKKELNIAVLEERLFKQLFPESNVKGLRGGQEIAGTPIIASWRDNEGKPHMKLGINEAISQQPHMTQLFYAMYGILDTIGGLPKPDAAKKAAELVKTLE